MASSSSAHVDTVALEVACAIMSLDARDCSGGKGQRQAMIQVAVVEAIRRCLPDQSNPIDSTDRGFTGHC